MEITDHIIMKKQGKGKAITERGVGIPRPGEEEVVERTPSTSSSGNRGRGQAAQVCFEKDATGRKVYIRYIRNIFMSASEGENSDTSDWFPFPITRDRNKNKKSRQSSSEENRSTDTKRKPVDPYVDAKENLFNSDIDPPPPSERAKRLLSAEELVHE
ncbi:hypothetical protein K0M31_007131 [Melipona bicolor]|uniref:Uncharacterized protein n=1 Tax=Melipona bicolor TaxID=60889 RepID=A0AA40KL47_9HYME|nr:hypothetical protein K0M31_007131 [Melipona bicolor]